jgi:hypothetical protein
VTEAEDLWHFEFIVYNTSYIDHYNPGKYDDDEDTLRDGAGLQLRVHRNPNYALYILLPAKRRPISHQNAG